MQKPNRNLKLSILLIALVMAGVGINYWGYPLYHLTRINEKILPKISKDFGAGDIQYLLSPNGTWEIEVSKNYIHTKPEKEVETTIQLSSIDFPLRKFIFSVPGSFLLINADSGPFVAQSWSPNGKSFFLAKLRNKFCLDQEIVLFNEVGGKWEGPYHYKPKTDNSGCYSFSWSADSTQLAKYTRFPKYNSPDDLFVTVLNAKGDSQHEFSVKSPLEGFDFDHRTWHLYWDEIKFMMINSGVPIFTDSEESTLYRFTSDLPDTLYKVMDMPSYHYVLGWDPTSSRILLVTFISNKCEYKVINTGEKQVEQSGVFDGDCYVASESLDHKYMALPIQNPSSENMHVKLWNWKTMKFVEKGSYEKVQILPWQDALRGFLILVEDEDGKKHFDILRP